jgi:ATP-dependent exoDNAse (exonuclease V) beta subunit
MLRSALTSVDLQPYFERIEGRRVLNEQEFVMADGSLTRMDRVVVDPDIVTVLDYKTGDEKPGYTEQVAKYMVILRDFYKTSEIRGFLVYIDRSLIRSIP